MPTNNLVLHLALFLLGLVSILGQVVLLRELTVAFYGVELIYALALGIWLLGTASGSLIRRNSAPSSLQVGSLFATAALFFLLDLAAIRALRPCLAPAPGAYLPFATQILSMGALLLPAGLTLGLLFQWCARLAVAAGGTLARAYAIESAGGVLGGLLSTGFLMVGIQNFTIALLCSLLEHWFQEFLP